MVFAHRRRCQRSHARVIQKRNKNMTFTKEQRLIRSHRWRCSSSIVQAWPVPTVNNLYRLQMHVTNAKLPLETYIMHICMYTCLYTYNTYTCTYVYIYIYTYIARYLFCFFCNSLNPMKPTYSLNNSSWGRKNGARGLFGLNLKPQNLITKTKKHMSLAYNPSPEP